MMKVAMSAMGFDRIKCHFFNLLYTDCQGGEMFGQIGRFYSLAKTHYPAIFKDRIKMFLRLLLWKNEAMEVVRFFNSHPLLAELLIDDKSLNERILRKYLRHTFTISTRKRYLLDHYELLLKHFSEEQIRQIYLKGGMCIATNEDNQSQLWLSHSWFGREGEFALLWKNASGDWLVLLQFNLIRWQGKTALYLAGMQGPKRDDARDLIKKSTKQNDGLRPKRAAMEGVYALAEFLGAETIIAVADDKHIGRSIWMRRKMGQKMFALHDDFWQELGGAEGHDGDWLLPVIPPERDISEIESKKRGEYRRRQARLQKIHVDAVATLRTGKL